MLEEFHSEYPVYRLTFSSIKCRIKLQDLSILALAVKIGKTYSQPTAKTQLNNGSLQFPHSISIPLNEDLIYDSNPRKQKCQVMLYRYYPEQKDKARQTRDLAESNITKKQKEKKNLIGMASLLISGQLFSQKAKTFRITNTFDKDATITCNVKISHDIFQYNQETISSIGQRSNPSSTPKSNNLPEDQPLNAISQIVRVQKQLNSKYKNSKVPELSISRMSEQKKRVSTKEMGSYSDRHMIQNYEEAEHTKTERIYGIKQQIFSGRIKRNDRHVQSYSEKYERKDFNRDEESHDIFQLCNNLQEQNNLLMNKIQNLQNHILNKSPSNQTARLEQGKLNKSQSLVKAMIKKNNTFTTSASTTITKVSDLKSISSTTEKTKVKQTGGQSPKILPNESSFSFKPPVRMISIKEMDVQHQSSKIITPRSQFGQKISFGFDQNSQVSPFENIQVKDSFSKSMKIDSVIAVTYVPPIQHIQPIEPIVRQFSESSKSKADKIQKSISHHQRSFSRSYSKFNIKRNHIRTVHHKISILHEIEKKDFGLQTENEKLLDIPKLKTISSQLDSPVFVTVNGQSGQGNNQKTLSTNEDKTNPIKIDIYAQRSTLQDVNRLIENKYRKTQKYLKLANQQLILQNKSLKKEKKLLEKQIQQKRNLSADQFMRLQQNSGNHEMGYYIKMLSEKDQQIERLSKKLHQAHQTNEDLQKNLREQKKTVAYFIKTSHLHDQKEKELDMKLKLIEQQFNIHDSIINSDAKQSKSHIVMPSPKVIYHSLKKPQQNQTHHMVERDEKRYATQRVQHNFNSSMSHYVPQIRFSVTKMTQADRKHPSNINPFSKSEIMTDRQKSVESKGLLSLKKHSVLNTKRTHDLSRQPNQFQNTFDNLVEKTNLKQNINQNFTQRKNLSINTNF